MQIGAHWVVMASTSSRLSQSNQDLPMFSRLSPFFGRWLGYVSRFGCVKNSRLLSSSRRSGADCSSTTVPLPRPPNLRIPLAFERSHVGINTPIGEQHRANPMLLDSYCRANLIFLSHNHSSLQSLRPAPHSGRHRHHSGTR